ncbi:MAG: hypothetical protein HYV52_00595 [Parcubacteria group bacterium]|nr:hypothetical protein [Parcubacteria group bacterium]
MIDVIQKAIDRGINFLSREQRRDGSFFCLVSAKLDDYSRAKKVPAIVPTNFVLSSLIHIKNPVADLPADLRFAGGFGKARTLAQAGRIKKKAANFLLKERGEYWSFNYWFRKSDWYKKEPYPDDTDDTFVPLAALYEYKPELFDGEAMARITTMLTSAEKQEGGPYDMWLVPPDARGKWNDTDLVCNANIAYFLSLQDIYLPKVTAFIEKKIENKGYEFPYNKIYPAIYFISRSYRGKKTEKMTRLLLRNQEKDGKWENPLRAALAISALINFSGEEYRERLKRGIQYLLRTQGKRGEWKPYSFYFQMRTKKKTLYAGSENITTALCLEAINKFNKLEIQNLKPETKLKTKIENSQTQIYRKVVNIVKERFLVVGEDLKKEAEDVISKTLKGDNGKQIVLLPFLFRESLGEKGKNIPDDLITRLGAANVFGWMAYTIYDDFLDEEGDPKLLSVANVALRESAEIFSSALPAHTRFATFAKNIFDTIDNANTWEIAHCRFNPHQQHPYKLENVRMLLRCNENEQLANKSIGHALGPAAILFALGYKDNSKEVKSLMQFFRHYIIARQLNDDAHDWEDDLKRGQVNAVGARLLRDTKSGSRKPEKSREVFWRKTIIGACKDISRHVNLAKNDLKKLSIIKEPAVFAEMLVAIERSAQKALKEREETIKFLKTYTSSRNTKSNL